jgi:hypothetical protein
MPVYRRTIIAMPVYRRTIISHLCKRQDPREMLANALTKVENKHAYLHFAKVFYNIRD